MSKSILSKNQLLSGGVQSFEPERALISNASGKIAVSEVTSGELATLQNIRSNVQDQIDAINLDGVSNKITNCILEIPQNIKLELSNETLTLKAGSKVYVPNGFEADGTTRKFDVVTIASDISVTKQTNNKCFVFYLNNSLYVWEVPYATSGSTAPSGTGTWYDTTNNLVKRYVSGSQTAQGLSFPLARLDVNSTAIQAIEQVFDGFGYIGNTIYMLPGVKGLLANGFNEDGSLKNYTWTNNSVKIRNLTSSQKDHKYITTNLVASIIGTIYDQISSDTQPTVPTTSFWYIPKDNLNAMVLSNGTANIPYNETAIGRISLDSTGRVLSLTPKTAFHAVDYNDFKQADDANVKLTGNQTVGGTKTFTDNIRLETSSIEKDIIFKNTTLDLTQSSRSSTLYSFFRALDKNGNIAGSIGYVFSTTGTSTAILQARNKVTGTLISGEIGINVDKNGTVYTSAPTPATSNNSTQIATTAYVNSKFQVVSALPANPDANVWYAIPE